MTARKLKLTVPSELEGERLDIFCARKVEDRTRSYFTKLASSGNILVDGVVAKAATKMKTGMKVEIELTAPPPLEAKPEDIPINIIYEDKRIAIVDKPPGMVVHPAAGNYEGTLVNALLHHFGKESINDIDPVRLGLVHRLDKDTSGLLIIAKDEQALVYLQRELKERNIKRIYYALVWGNLDNKSGTIELPIGRSEKDRKKMTVNPRRGKEAVTEYEVIELYKYFSLLRIKLQTGRTHQIRVHLSHFGHPVVGDSTYGGRSNYLRRFDRKDRMILTPIMSILDRQALHAKELIITHPDDDRIIEFQSELPEDFSKAILFAKTIDEKTYK
jgi:23S rRNA pseudouridine1911/1915/1917 synthase